MTYKHLAALRDHVEAFIKDRLESHEMTVNSYESTVSPTHARSHPLVHIHAHIHAPTVRFTWTYAPVCPQALPAPLHSANSGTCFL